MHVFDISGQTFGRWTVTARAVSKPGKQARWHCKCSCGNGGEVGGAQLRSGWSKSCGCLKREQTISRFTTHGHATHGITPTYHTWAGMRARCSNPKNHKFERYGGRGISVCLAWTTFAGFLADMGEKPPGTSLERIDNNGNYCPENCRWATPTDQARNKRNNRLLTFRGESRPLAEWADRVGIKSRTIWDRLATGWRVEDALTIPAGTGNRRAPKKAEALPSRRRSRT